MYHTFYQHLHYNSVGQSFKFNVQELKTVPDGIVIPVLTLSIGETVVAGINHRNESIFYFIYYAVLSKKNKNMTAAAISRPTTVSMRFKLFSSPLINLRTIISQRLTVLLKSMNYIVQFRLIPTMHKIFGSFR